MSRSIKLEINALAFLFITHGHKFSKESKHLNLIKLKCKLTKQNGTFTFMVNLLGPRLV